MSSCPTSDELRAFHDEKLGVARRDQLYEHVRECESCQRSVERLSGILQPTLQLAPPDNETTSAPPADALEATVVLGDQAQAAIANHVREDAQRRAGYPRVPGYELTEEIGRGGMGIVYKARHLALNRVVALKTLRSAALVDAQQLVRFRTEAEALAQIQHPHIVQVFEIGNVGGTPFLTMEFVAGTTLEAAISANSFTPAESALCVERLATAMFSAHQRGVLHRDLKPSNILLTDDAQPKITDFGLAKCLTNDSQMTLPETIMGTPSYMPPEQAQGRLDDLGPHSDIYSLGAVLYELLTGRPPFRGSTPLETVRQVVRHDPTPPRSLAPKTPRDLETICLKCLHKEPARRYATAADLADDLVRFRRGEPIAARRIGLVGRGWRWCQRNRTLSAALAIAFCAIVAGSMAVVWQRQQTQQARQATQQQYLRFTAEADEKFNVIEDLMQRIPEDQLAQDQRLRSALASYEEWLNEEPTGEAAQASYADALFRIAEIRRRIGQYDQAESVYRRACDRYRELLHSSPDHVPYRVALADALNWLGESLREGGRPAEAIATYEEAMAQLRQLARQTNDDSKYQADLARSYYNRALAQIDLRKHTEAEHDLRRSIDMLEAVQPANAASAAVRQSLARSHTNLAILLRATERAAESYPHYLQASAIYQALTDDSPRESEFRLERAVALNNMANLLYGDLRRQELGQNDILERASSTYETSIEILRELVREFANVPRYRKELANSLNGLGAVKLDAKDLPAAEQAWDAASVELRSLVKRSPEVAEYPALLAQTTFNRAYLSHQQQRTDDRIELLAEAIALQRRAVALSAENVQYQQTLKNYERAAARFNATPVD